MGGLFLATLRDPLTAAERTLLVCRQLPRIECCSKILRGYQIGCQQFGLKRYLWFDLDGTLVDSVYQHILAFREALDEEGIEFLVWRIRRKIGMSGACSPTNC